MRQFLILWVLDEEKERARWKMLEVGYLQYLEVFGIFGVFW